MKQLVVLVLLVGVGCSSLPKSTVTHPDLIAQSICAYGEERSKIMGTIWTKFEDPELKGQFPASVLVDPPNDKLTLEITNLLNAPQAWVEFNKGRLSLKLTEENERSWKGMQRQFEKNQRLSGLPLKHAVRLFSGRFPCPKGEGQWSLDQWTLSWKTPIEAYSYILEQRGSAFWVKQLTLKDKLAERTFVFDFYDPIYELKDVPKRWSVKELDSKTMKSLNELHVRWKDFKSF